MTRLPIRYCTWIEFFSQKNAGTRNLKYLFAKFSLRITGFTARAHNKRSSKIAINRISSEMAMQKKKPHTHTQTIIGGEKGSQQMEYIPLVTTLKFPRFSCKRLKIKKIHRYFVSAIVTAHQTKKLMLCHIDRVFRRCCGNYCWVDIALCCSVRIVQCQHRITRISNFYALTVSRRFHGPILRTVLARSLNIF